MRLSRNSFGDGSVYLEKFVARAKHVEVQIFGDGKGGILTLGLRDCSAQRRHQKVIEETPVPGLDAAQRNCHAHSAELLGQGRELCFGGNGRVSLRCGDARVLLSGSEHAPAGGARSHRAGDWTGPGGDDDPGGSRRAAATRELRREPDRASRGCSIEARIYCEDPAQELSACAGQAVAGDFSAAEMARVETWVESGTEITPFYDPMIAKIIVTGADRTEAVAQAANMRWRDARLTERRPICAICARLPHQRHSFPAR